MKKASDQEASATRGRSRQPLTLMRALEPRIMFDASVAATLVDVHAPEHVVPAAHESTSTPVPLDSARGPLGVPDAVTPASGKSQIVFVDVAVGDYKTLVADIDPSAEVVLIGANQNGLQVIADTLAGRTSVDAIHIVSHGLQGQVTLGNITLDQANLDVYAATLQSIGSRLGSEGDILLYGCDVGSGSLGQAFIGRLAQLTQADVAASNDATGSSATGGDWVLEAATGTIEAGNPFSAAAQEAFSGRLFAGTLDFSGSDASLGTSVNDGEANSSDISGVVIEIYSANAGLGTNNGTAWAYYSDLFSDGTGGSDEAIVDDGGSGAPVIVIRSQSGAEFSFAGIKVVDYLGSQTQVTFEGFRDGVSTGSVTLNTDGSDYISDFNQSNGLTTSIFQNVDEVRLTNPTLGNNQIGIDNIAFADAAPTVTSVNSSTANATYKIGDAVSVQVNFSEAVTVTGTPQLTLETGTTDRVVNYASGSGTSTLTFTYTVQAGDTSADLDYQSTSALAFNGGTIKNGASVGATLTLASPGAAGSLGANKAIVIDGVVPTVTSVNSSTANGTYKAGDTVSVQVNFSEAVTVTGTPQLTLETGTTDRVVNYASGSGTSTLSFTYTVQAGDNSADLDYLSTTALALNGGTIKDAAGNAGTLILASPGAANSLGNNKALVIDGVAPTVTSVNSSTTNGTYKVGDTVSVQVNFSEAVTVTGTPQLTLETGTTDEVVNYASGSGTSTLTFTYTVQAGDTSADLDYQSTSALALNGGTIRDAASNAAILTLASPGAANSLGNNKALVIDATPVISNLNGDSAAWAGVGSTVVLDANSNAFLTDTEFGALNSGNGDWAGASLTVQRSGSAISTDTLGFNTPGALFTVSGSNLQSGGLTFATFTNSGGVLTVTYTSSGTAATSELVNDVAQRITYRNDTPSGDATLHFALSDGTASTTADVTVASDTIFVTNSIDTATIDITNGVSFSEAIGIAAADVTGSQTIAFAGALSGTSLAVGGVTLNESLIFDMDAASGMSLTTGTISIASGTTLTLSNGTGDTATVSSSVSGSSGALTKVGAGTVTLSNTNSYTGATTVSAGTLAVSGTNAIATGSSVSVSAGAILSLSADQSVGNLSGAGSINLGSSSLSTRVTADSTFSGGISGTGAFNINQTGAATFALTLSGTNTFTGATTLQNFGWLKLDGDAAYSNSSALRVNGNSKLTLLSDQTVGSIASNASTASLNLGSFTLTAGGDNTSTSVAGVMSGTGALAKQGSGTMTLSGTNTYTGATTVSAGSLSLSSGTAIVDGGAVSVASGAILNIAASETIGSLAGAGSVTLGANTLTAGGDNTSTGFSGGISGTGGALTKTGSGTFTLSGTNSYTGATLVSGGTLSIAADSNLGSGTLTLATNTTLALTGTTTVDNAIALSGNATVNATANATLSGNITGAGGLTKAGSSTLTLSGTDGFTGATSVSAGALIVNGALSGTSGMTVASGATLGGSGSIFASSSTNTLTVQSGGTLSPGNSAGTITVNGNLSMASGSTLAVDINGATAGTGYDQIIVNGTVAVSGATLAATHGYTAGSGDIYDLIVNDVADAITGTFAGVSEGSSFAAGGDSTNLTASYLGGTGNDFSLAAPVFPHVTSVSTITPDGTYKVGDTITLVVSFSEAVHLSTGTIQLTLETGTTDEALSYLAGSGTSTLYFNYTVQSGDNSLDLDYVSTTALNANGDTIQSGSFNDAVLTLPTPGAAGSLGAGADLVIDGVAPTVSSVAVPANATYVAGQNLDFTVNYNEAVTVNTGGGTPYVTVTLDTGGTVDANYISGSGTSALVFRYTVATGNLDTNGLTIGGSITANGGTLRDAAGNDANATLNSVGSTTGVLVDAVAPTIASVAVPTNGTYVAGQNLDFTVNYDEAVLVNTGGGTPYVTVTLDTGGTVDANYISGSGTNALTFRYTVSNGNMDTNGITVGGSITTNGGTLHDAAGNNADTTLNSVGSTTNVLVDAVPPAVNSVAVPANATYVAGQNLDFTVNFGEAVVVDTSGGTPYVAVTLDTGGTVHASYLSGSGTGALVFRYTVANGNLDTNGITVGALTNNGGTLRDAAGNNATLTLNSVGSTASVLVDAIPPVIATDTGSAAFTAGDNTVSTPVVIDSGLMLTDGGSTTASSATVSITSGFQGGEDVLAFTNDGSTMGNIGATYDGGTGAMTLTSSGGTASIAQWQAALRSVTYTDSAVTPNNATRTVSFSLNDGLNASNTATRTVTVAGTEQTPIITTSGGTTAFIEGANITSIPVAIDAALTLGDLDSTTLSSATVSITGNFHSAEDALAFTNDGSNMGNIGASYNSGTGVMTLTSSGATATLAQWQSALRTVTYTNSSDLPNTSNRTLNFVVNDGTKSSTASTRTLSVTSVNDAPVNGMPAAQNVNQDSALTFSSGGGNAITVSDGDANGGSEQVTLTATHGTLALAGTSGLSFSVGSGAGDATMTFTGTLANIDSALDGMVFTPTAGYSGAASLQVVSNDLGLTGSGGAKADTDTLAIAVNPINPVVSNVSATTPDGSYKVGDTLTLTVAFDANVTVDTAGGTPTLLLETGTVDHAATYVSGSGTNTLSFSYTVQAGDQSLDLDYNGTAALSLNGATIRNSVTSLDAVVTLPATGGVHSIAGQKAVVVDGVVPAVSSVAVPANGTYVAGQNLDFTVNLSEAVVVNTVGGTPRIAVTLETGGTVYANYVSGSGTTALTFRATVASGEADANGIALGGSVDLNGATMRDAIGNDANIALTGVASTVGVRVDAVAPTGSLALISAPGTGDTLVYELAFSEDVNGVDASDFMLTNTGNVTAAIGNVQAVDAHTYRIMLDGVKGSGSVTLDLHATGSGIADAAGNALATDITTGAHTISNLVTVVTPMAPPPLPPVVSAPVSALATPLIVLPTVTDFGPDTSAPALPGALTIDSLLAGSGRFDAPYQTSNDLHGFDVIPPGAPYLGIELAHGGLSLQSMPDLGAQHIRNDQPFRIVLPHNTFSEGDKTAHVAVEVHLTNGRPLPSWLKFDPVTGTFFGRPPSGFSGEVDIEVLARDSHGNRASSVIHLEFRAPRVLGRSSLDAQLAAAGARSANQPEAALLRHLRVAALEREFAERMS